VRTFIFYLAGRTIRFLLSRLAVSPCKRLIIVRKYKTRSVESNLSGKTHIEVESTVIAITRAVTRHTAKYTLWHLPGCRAPRTCSRLKLCARLLRALGIMQTVTTPRATAGW